MKKPFAQLLLLAMLAVAIPASALSAEFLVPQNNNDAVSLPSGDSARNLYAGGNTVNVSGSTNGDLVTAGNTLNLSGDVQQSLFAAGSILTVDGRVGQNSRLAGSNITLNSSTGSDLFAVGGVINLTKGSLIGGDVYAAAGSLTINGEVAGRVRISGGEITINGTIGGDVVIDGGRLSVGDNAIINGKLDYRSNEEASISKSAVIRGGVNYQKVQAKDYSKSTAKGILGVLGFLGFLMSLVILFALVYVLPKSSKVLIVETLANFWTNLGWGFLFFAVAPTALLLIAITVVGLKLALAIGLVYLAALMVAFIYSNLVIGSQILKWFEKGREYRVDWATILIGVITTTIIGLIPFLGGLIVLAVSLAVLGRMLIYFSAFLKSQRN